MPSTDPGAGGPGAFYGLRWRVALFQAAALAAVLAAFAVLALHLADPARGARPGDRWLLAALAAGAVGAALVLNHLFFSRTVLRRLDLLVARFRAHEREAQAPDSGLARPVRDEIDLLHHRFDRMLAGLRRTHQTEIEMERRLVASRLDERHRGELELVNGELSARIFELDGANDRINRLALQLEERNASLEKAVKNISALNRVGVALSSELDIDRLAQLVINISVKGLRVEIGALFLYDESREQLVVRASSGLPAGAAARSLAPGESVSGSVALSGQALLARSVDGSQGVAVRSRYGFVRRSVLCVPIRIKDRVLGTIELTNRRGEESFGEEDLRMLQSIANQAAVAIENANLYRDVQRSYLETIRALVQAVEEKDQYTRGHSERVTLFALKIARAMELTAPQLRMLQYAGVLHDIGKIGIDLSIIHKTGRLTADEYRVIKNHPLIGERIIRPIGFLAEALPAVAQHHERFDGCGYPLGLTGGQMTLEARILAVADAYDAMITERPYRKPLPRPDAVAELRRCSGSQFDPAVVEYFIGILDNDSELQRLEVEISTVGT